MKQAVVLILDSNCSMAKEYENGSSRFDCAKQVAQDVICDLMIQSKTNEVAVILLKSSITRHHFHEPDSENEDDMSEDDDEEIPYQNILEFGGSGEAVMVARPTPSLLRKIDDLQVNEKSQSLRGDFCDGIIVAADSLFKRTNKKKYQRRIVLITDAEHRVEVDGEQLSEVLNGLYDLECTLEVIGLDFGKEAKFSKPSAGGNLKVKKEPKEEEDDGSETDAGEDDDNDEDDEVDTAFIKSQNESLLISMTERTGGYVMSAKELKTIYKELLGKRKTKSVRRKVDFQIAPGVSMECRFSLLLSKATVPSLKKRVLPIDDTYTQSDSQIKDDEDAKTSNDPSPEEMLNMKKIESHFDAENEEVEITNRGQAYKYGSDLVPMSAYDLGGLTVISEVKLKIIGYMETSKVPQALCVGPPYLLSGADSRKACAAVSALARGLERTKKVAIATFVQMRNRDPSLVGIFPDISQLPKKETAEDQETETAKYENPIHLIILKLPFMGDVGIPDRNPLEEHDESKEKVCDDLIDALMLEGEQVEYTRIANPTIRSYWKTVMARVKDPKHPLVMARDEHNDDIATPKKVLEGAKGALDSFHENFPLPSVDDKRKTTKK